MTHVLKGLMLVTAIAVSGCSTSSGGLGMFINGDLTNAAAVATANGDTAGAQCATALAGATMPTPTPTNDGLFTIIERKRLVGDALKGPQCAPITAQVLINATHAVPILGNVLGTVGF